MQTYENNLKSYFDLLTPRIEKDVPAWYGSDAQLIGEPTFHPRRWSYFFRYRVRLNNGNEKAVLAKIRHIKNMEVMEAARDEKMGEEMREESDSLLKIWDIFSNIREKERFAAIRHLALYGELNTLVMEEADIRTLQDRYGIPPMWMSGGITKKFVRFLDLTGKWLRVFHDHFGDAEAGPYFSERLYENAQANLEKIETFYKHPALVSAKGLLERLYQKKNGSLLAYRMLHDNFSLNNVFLTGDERICSFDPHNRPGPLYVDLARLITDLEASRIQVVTNGLSVPPVTVRALADSFLNGYFEGDPVDHVALNTYRLLVLIEKWQENEFRVDAASGRKKILYSLTIGQMRRYFTGLLQGRMNEKNFDL